MGKILRNKEILAYQDKFTRQLKLDLYQYWLRNQCFNLRYLYVQWLMIAYVNDIQQPRVRSNPSPIDLELYDGSTNKHYASRLGILRR